MFYWLNTKHIYYSILFRYTPDIDIEELITLEDVMEEFDLGPNGGLVYCMEFLQTNIDWLVEKLNEKQSIFVCSHVLIFCR